MYRQGIILKGTAHDDEGTITMQAECDGIHISKNDQYTTGKIVLTLDELKELVIFAQKDLSMRTELPNLIYDSPIPLPQLTHNEQAEEAHLRG